MCVCVSARGRAEDEQTELTTGSGQKGVWTTRVKNLALSSRVVCGAQRGGRGGGTVDELCLCRSLSLDALSSFSFGCLAFIDLLKLTNPKPTHPPHPHTSTTSLPAWVYPIESRLLLLPTLLKNTRLYCSCSYFSLLR